MNKDLNRHLLLQMWQGLGGPRPEQLVRVEFILWRALFDVALGRHPLSSRFRAAFREIEAIDLSCVGYPDSEWLSGDASFQESTQKRFVRKQVTKPIPEKQAPSSPLANQEILAPTVLEAVSNRPTTRSVTAQQKAKATDSAALIPIYPPSTPSPRKKLGKKREAASPSTSSNNGVPDEDDERDAEPTARKRTISTSSETNGLPSRPRPLKAPKLEDGTSKRRIYETIDLTVETRGPPVIDLTVDEADHFERFNAEPVTLCSKTAVSHVASFHYAQEAEWFSALWRAVGSCNYGSDVPSMSPVTNAFFMVVSSMEIEQMPVSETQKIFKRSAIVVPGALEQRPLPLDLRALTMLDKPMQIEDFPHVPNIFQHDGIIDLLSLCNVLELSNAALYTLSDFDRHRTVEARRLCRRIVAWLEAQFIFSSPHGIRLEIHRDIWMLFLARQVKALLSYRDLVGQRGNPGNFRAKMEACLINHTDLSTKLAELSEWQADNFDWPDEMVFQVNVRQSPGLVTDDIQGETSDDNDHFAVLQ
ncbi:hypothetical protein H1R20_g15422, partial [Candolleomyces eurysporus]